VKIESNKHKQKILPNLQGKHGQTFTKTACISKLVTNAVKCYFRHFFGENQLINQLSLNSLRAEVRLNYPDKLCLWLKLKLVLFTCWCQSLAIKFTNNSIMGWIRAIFVLPLKLAITNFDNSHALLLSKQLCHCCKKLEQNFNEKHD